MITSQKKYQELGKKSDHAITSLCFEALLDFSFELNLLLNI
jgi:hypothetical protein